MTRSRPAVHLLSGPIHSGKTTRLSEWAAGRSDVDGILAPVVDGRRRLRCIGTGAACELETLQDGETPVAIGPHRFSPSAFAAARAHLAAAAGRRVRWIVIDEIGPLELRGEGLEPAVSLVFDRLATAPRPASTELVIVVRESLVDRVLAHYGVPHDRVRPFGFPPPGVR